MMPDPRARRYRGAVSDGVSVRRVLPVYLVVFAGFEFIRAFHHKGLGRV